MSKSPRVETGNKGNITQSRQVRQEKNMPKAKVPLREE
tara:strand:- start:191 stop:304 length:114 start_codon:yes stop_codon:yes gene_type:complete